jgi:cyanophycin synthetase
MLAGDKWASKAVLVRHGLPTPAAFAVDLEDEAAKALEVLGGLVAVKPNAGSQGRGVSTNLNDEEQVRHAFRQASRVNRVVMVERHHVGRDHRILVVDGKVAAVTEREPPAVAGDGVRSIGELVTALNKDPRRGEDHEKPMTKIVINSRVQAFLQRSDRTSLTVPAPDETVALSAIGSMSQGSRSIDRTDLIHPEIEAVAVEAAKAIGLDIAGVDILARDIGLPLREADAQIIEVNSSPGLRMHLFPAEGQARNVAAPILDYLFPESRSSAGAPGA